MPSTITGIKELTAYLNRLKTGVPAAIAKPITGPDALEKRKQEARSLLENIVYAVAPVASYPRTKATLNAVNAAPIDDRSSGVGIEMTDAAAAITGNFEKQYTYARHMLKEYGDLGKGSFHHYEMPRLAGGIDFLEAWFAFFKVEVPMEVKDELAKEMRRR